MAHKEGGIIYRVCRAPFNANTFCIQQLFRYNHTYLRAVRLRLLLGDIVVAAFSTSIIASALVAVGPAWLTHSILSIAIIVGDEIGARTDAHTSVIFYPKKWSLARGTFNIGLCTSITCLVTFI